MKDTRQQLLLWKNQRRKSLFHGEIAVKFRASIQFSWRISRENCGNNILSLALAVVETLFDCWVGPGLYRLYPTFIIQQLWNVHLYTFHQHSLMEEISKSYTSWSLTILIWKTSVFGFDTASRVVSRISINFRSINSRERSAPKNLLDIRWSVSHHPKSSKADRYVVAPGHLCA